MVSTYRIPTFTMYQWHQVPSEDMTRFFHSSLQFNPCNRTLVFSSHSFVACSKLVVIAVISLA